MNKEKIVITQTLVILTVIAPAFSGLIKDQVTEGQSWEEMDNALSGLNLKDNDSRIIIQYICHGEYFTACEDLKNVK